MYSHSLVMSFHSNLSACVSKQQIPLVRGFGLIELMVSISIMALVAGVVLTRHAAFNGAVLLRNQAYEVAFAIRKAQLLAVSGNNAGATGSTQQYGVYFNETDGLNTNYVIFNDVDADGRYDKGAPDIDIELGTFDKLFDIRDVYNGSSAPIAGDQVSITFRRPNFDAIFTRDNGTAISPGPVYIDIAQVGTNSSAQGVGVVRRVEITRAGQINVTKY